ncbi:MAG: glycosyltransferase family 39 protein [Candidatus Hydrogenedentes bacterium]|nr:glycosyltransferase family 39 protein [Candidatus Hydrogenedentota bacterium]
MISRIFEKPTEFSTFRTKLYLIIIVFLGFLNRAWNLNNLSLWLDEFVTTYKLFQVPLSDFFSYFFTFHSDQAPISHIIFYILYKLFPFWFSNVEKLRWLPVLIGTLNIFLTYKLGKKIYSDKVGLFSAFIFALSPYHTLFSQLIRPYIFMELFALLSLLTTTNLLKNCTHKNFIFWAVVNILLILTHLMMIILILLEILFLTLYFFVEKQKKAYSLLTFTSLLIFIIPPIYFISNSVPIYTIEDDYLMRTPRLFNLLIDLFADDAVISSEPFFFQGQTFGFSPTLAYWIKEAVNIHYIFDISLLSIGIFAIAFHLFSIFHKFKAHKIFEKIFQEPKHLFIIFSEHIIDIFLCTVVVMPVLAIALTSFFRPCYQTRYSLYSSIALYILISNAILLIQERGIKKLLIAWLLVPLVYYFFISGISIKTTNFKDLTKVLSKHLNENDSILAWGIFYLTTPFTNEVTAYYLRKPIEKVTPVYSYKDVLEKTKKIYSTTTKENPTVWLIIEPYVLNFPNENIIEYMFWKSRIDYDKYFFPGMNGLWLYKLTKTDASFSEEVEIPNFTNYLPFLKVLSKTSPDYDLQKAEEKLSRLIDFSAPPTPMFWNYISWCALDRNDPEFAEVCARCAISIDPDLPWGYHSLAVSLTEQGKIDEGISAMEQCIKRDNSKYHNKKYMPIFKAIYLNKDATLARILIRTLESEGGFIPMIYKKRTGIMSN